MSRLGFLVAAVIGLAVPVALALAVYVASAGTLAEPIEGTPLPSERIARPSVTTTAADRAARSPARGRDVSGPCDEAEHANDPRCTGVGTTQEDDRSGRSGSSGGSDDSSNSGSGSSGSGDSGDDDDSSGQGRGRGRSGSSGSDSSGSGSGDD